MRIRSLFRYAVLLAVSLLLAFPARAVVPEKDFQSTLNSLLQELRQSYASAQESDTLMVNNREQREAFDRVLKSADEVTIMLYTQRPEFTFDMAFALEEVSRVRSAFHEQVLLNDQYRIAARSGLRRYELLNETLPTPSRGPTRSRSRRSRRRPKTTKRPLSWTAACFIPAP